ncbi:MAG TPA: class I SAM-dependent methyltransferase [Dehalococcoidia bacterium]|nr:class I SAM-dependent methyltransferase [Dehalococcoidia bacterium]
MATTGDLVQGQLHHGRADRLPTPAEVRALADQYDFFNESAVRAYLHVALDRLLYTLRLLRRIPLQDPSVLEIGARPYFMTMLLREYLGYNLTALNEPTAEAPERGVHTLRHLTTGELIEIPYVCANIEQQPFPLADASFDLVVFAEVIEHLTYDPTHSLAEIHRVLKPGGYLVISTPNALRWDYLRKMIRGKNYYPPYSGYGTTARHNREFSMEELRELLDGCGYDVLDVHSVRDAAYDHPKYWDRAVGLLNRFGFWRDRLDVIHLIARRREQRRLFYPEHLYYDLQAYRRVVDSGVRMGENDQLQIDHSSFFPLEDWPPKVRWAKPKCTVYLLGNGQQRLGFRFFSGERAAPVVVTTLVNGETAGTITCPPSKWFEGEIALPTAKVGEVEVSLQVDRPLIPANESNTPDTRELGVALQWIELT